MTRRIPKNPVHRDRRHGKYSVAIMTLYDEKCALCGKKRSDTIDHTVPVAWGGSDHPQNLKPAHRSCNSSKGADMPERWTWKYPLMWQRGFGANVEGTVKVPHWDYAGVKTFILFIIFGGLFWMLGKVGGIEWSLLAGASLILIPIIYNIALLLWWRRACKKATIEARLDRSTANPEAWLEEAFARKNSR